MKIYIITTLMVFNIYAAELSNLDHHDELKELYQQMYAIDREKFGKTIASPTDLKKKVIQIIARRQKGMSCGYNVVGACDAMKECTIHNQLITSESIQAGTTAYLQKNDFLEVETLLPLARIWFVPDDEEPGNKNACIVYLLNEAHIPDAYCISIVDSKIQCFGSSEVVQFGEYDKAVQQLNNIEESGVLYFPFLMGDRDGGHWTLITLLKLPYKMPLILFFDSLNCSLHGREEAQCAINELYQMTKQGRQEYKKLLCFWNAWNIACAINIKEKELQEKQRKDQQESVDLQIAHHMRQHEFTQVTGWNPSTWLGWSAWHMHRFGWI